MKTRLIPIHAPVAAKKAGRLLHQGKVIIYPTETSYALGCDATSGEAIQKLREVKQRPDEKPLPIIVDSLATLKWYAVLSEEAVKLVDAFMPGPLTLVVPKKNTLPDALGKETVAFRISGHPFARAVCAQSRIPVIATSANVSGETPLYEINPAHTLLKGVDAVFDAGTLPPRKASTIYHLSTRSVLREGEVSLEQIREAEEGAG